VAVHNPSSFMARMARVKTSHGKYKVKAYLANGIVMDVNGQGAHC
jgi:hypothetical protein